MNDNVRRGKTVERESKSCLRPLSFANLLLLVKKAELTHMVDSNQLIAQFTRLERAVGEWEPKMESLMKSNPTDLHVSIGPDPYTAEVEVQTQRLGLVRNTRKFKQINLAEVAVLPFATP